MRSLQLLWITILLLLVSCTQGPEPFDVGPIFPATQNESLTRREIPPPAHSQIKGTWIQLDLSATLALAGANDLQIAHARERLIELQAQRDAALYRFFPSLQPGAAFQQAVGEYMDTSGTFVDVTRQQTIAGIRARLQLNLGAAVFELEAAGHLRDGGAANLEANRNRRLLEAARGYYELVASVQNTEIAREALIFAEAQLVYFESRQRQGFGLEVDVERARARLEAERMALADAELRFKNSSTRLATQLRLDPRVTLYPAARTLTPEAFVPEDSSTDDLVVAALMANPELSAARANLAAADARLASARWAWMIPTLFLEGGLDERGENPRRFGDTESFTAGLQWELALGIGARQNAAHARRNQVAIELAQARENLVAGIVSLRDSLTLTRKRITASERRIKAARAALEFTESRMRAGTGLQLEVLDARVELTHAQVARLDAITRFNRDQVALLVLTGTSPMETQEKQP